MKQLFALALLVALPASLTAQRMSSAHFRGGFSNLPGHFSQRGYPRAGYYPLGLFDPFYADYLSDGYPVASQPQMILLQPRGPSADPEPAPAPTQPLMIELQGDRYVQVSGDQPSRAQMIDPTPVSQSESRSVLLTHSQPASAVLVFRDGHRQETSSYTIADGILYAPADYATTGAWNQKIKLSSLNVPETVANNSSRGLHFQLPSSPNEVIVGP
jgi:hypothetical protein